MIIINDDKNLTAVANKPTFILIKNTPISTYRRLLIFIEFKILIVLTEILKTK